MEETMIQNDKSDDVLEEDIEQVTLSEFITLVSQPGYKKPIDGDVMDIEFAEFIFDTPSNKNPRTIASVELEFCKDAGSCYLHGFTRSQSVWVSQFQRGDWKRICGHYDEICDLPAFLDKCLARLLNERTQSQYIEVEWQKKSFLVISDDEKMKTILVKSASQKTV